MIRHTLGSPEPTKFEIEKMMVHADAWRDSPASPERLAHINQLAADFYQACYPDSWAQPYLTNDSAPTWPGTRTSGPATPPPPGTPWSPIYTGTASVRPRCLQPGSRPPPRPAG